MLNNIVHFIISLVVIFGLAWLISYDRKKIKIRYIFQLVVVELALAWVLLYTSIGLSIVGVFASVFSKLMDFAGVGTNFVFGGLVNQGSFSFFLFVLCPIIFISTLIGILQHFRILPLIVRIIGTVLSKINGMPKLESFNAVSSLMVGQSENFIAIKDLVHKMNEKRMYTLSATAISTVSMSIVGSYMTMLEPRYVVMAIILNMFSTFAVLQTVNPYDVSEQEEKVLNVPTTVKRSFFEMLGEYILAGFKMAIIVAAMLIGFNALLAMVNFLFEHIIGISFQGVMGYIFYPVAWILGIPTPDLLKAGSIMGTKLVANEFVAMLQMKDIASQLAPKTLALLSVFLVSFANIATLGIIAGSVKSISEEQGDMVARSAFRLIVGATLVSVLSAAIVGLLIS